MHGIDYKRYLTAAAVSVAISAALLFAAAAAAMAFDDPATAAPKAGAIASFFSCFLCGYVSVKILRGNVKCAAVYSVLYVLFLTAVSLVFFERSYSAGISIVLHAAAVAICFLGGVAAAKRNTGAARRRYRKKRRR